MKKLGVLLALVLLAIPLSVDAQKCPEGTYYGLDNQGNEACRDIKTNQIVDPVTGLMYDSQTGELILDENQNLYLGIGVIVVLIIIGAIAVARKKETPYKELPRRGFSDAVKEEVLRKQNHRCAKCDNILNVVDWDHKDGNKMNDDISNCQALCPNCHAIKSRKEQSRYDDSEE